MQDEIAFWGHPNVQSLHARTVEITTEEHLTLRGDCIVGVKADRACADINEKVRKRLMQDGLPVMMEIIVGSMRSTRATCRSVASA